MFENLAHPSARWYTKLKNCHVVSYVGTPSENIDTPYCTLACLLARWHVNHAVAQARWHVGMHGTRFSKLKLK